MQSLAYIIKKAIKSQIIGNYCRKVCKIIDIQKKEKIKLNLNINLIVYQ